MAAARPSRTRPRRERRHTRAERVVRKVPPSKLFAGIHGPLVRALDLLGPQSKQISTAWRKLLRRLEPDRKEFEALKTLASLDLGEQFGQLRSADYDSYFEAARLQGQALSVQGVPEDQAVTAVAFYLESALSRLLDQTSEKGLALALVRLSSAIQRFVLAGYSAGRARGWRRIDEQERLKLSRDLHDDIGADLVVLKLYIEMIGLELKRGRVEQIGAKLDEALALVAHAVESVRRITLDLGPAILDQIGLAPAVKLYCRQFSARTGISVQVHEAQLPGRAPVSHETALYRVLQGALSNVVKHARARNVKVHLGALRNKVIVMIIEDDGVGFDASNHPPQGAFGLTAMRDRIESLGGRIHVESRPGRRSGARIEIDLPLREDDP